MMNKRAKKRIVSGLIFLAGVAVIGFALVKYIKPDGGWISSAAGTELIFDGERAMRDVEYQVNLGPRVPGSSAHEKTINWIVAELNKSSWETQIQYAELMKHPIKNIVGKWEGGDGWIIIGAHFDSRFFADHDPILDNRTKPVPGANDGASGVAVLLELARIWPSYTDGSDATSSNPEVWLVFFDAEDNGNIPGWDWILGSRAFVSELNGSPDAAVIIDMIGDKNLNLYKEINSDPVLVDEIWSQADELGYGMYFLPRSKHKILDDHVPFLEAGIPAVDLIDFDYPYYHTVEDTTDKVSAASLQIIGETLLAWLTKK